MPICRSALRASRRPRRPSRVSAAMRRLKRFKRGAQTRSLALMHRSLPFFAHARWNVARRNVTSPRGLRKEKKKAALSDERGFPLGEKKRNKAKN